MGVRLHKRAWLDWGSRGGLLAHLAEAVDSLLVAHPESLEVVLRESQHQTCHCQSNSLHIRSTSSATAFPRMIEIGPEGGAYEVLIVHDGDYPERPLGRRDHVRVLPV